MSVPQDSSHPISQQIIAIIAPLHYALTAALIGVPGRRVIYDFQALQRAIDEDIGIVVSPVMGGDYDITDVAKILAQHGYTGRLWGYADRLPAPDMIVAEVKSIWPLGQIDISQLTLPRRVGNTR